MHLQLAVNTLCVFSNDYVKCLKDYCFNGDMSTQFMKYESLYQSKRDHKIDNKQQKLYYP